MEVITLLSEAEMTRRLTARGRPVRPKPPFPLLFPGGLVQEATRHLWRNGQHGLEQLVLWAGYPTPNGMIISSLLLPGTEADWGWVRILPTEQPRISEWLLKYGQLLFVEAHTHGNGPLATEMSEEDRRHPAGRQDGFLTVIVPGYARTGIDFRRAGIWECGNLSWFKLPPAEVTRRVRVISDEEARNALR